MIESLVLIEGNSLEKSKLEISLSNAKQLVIGNTPGFGFILHIAANSQADLSNALLKFGKIKGVTGVLVMALHT